jgi:hypothetical protein
MSKRNDAPELLIDRIYKMTFGPPVEGWESNKLMRRAITEARRFTLDQSMSSFLADLACAIFDKRADKIRSHALNFARRNARLPHEVTWIEFYGVVI